MCGLTLAVACTQLQVYPNLTCLDASNCRGLTNVPVTVVQHSPKLRTLLLADARVGCRVPLQLLHHVHTALTHLDLSGNPHIPQDGLEAMV